MPSTNLTDFRNQYLAKVKGRLTSADITNASDTDLILQSALLKAYDAVNRFDAFGPDAVAPIASMTGAELQESLADASTRQAFEALLSSGEAMRALAASSAAMTAVAASPAAMTALLANSSAWAAVVANSNAMAAVAANSNAMAAVAASSAAMTALFSSSVARAAIWASATAMTAIQNAPSAVLDALQSHAQVSMMNNSPSNLQGTFISGKSMTLRVRNTGGSDTNYMRTLAGGSGTGDDVFTTSITWTARVRAYNNLTHYTWNNNYTFQAYVVNMN